MSARYQPSPRGGVAGVALLFCIAFGGAGLAVDYLLDEGPRWLLTRPGARALLGVAVVLVLLACAYVLRWALGRPAWKTKEERDARDSA